MKLTLSPFLTPPWCRVSREEEKANSNGNEISLGLTTLFAFAAGFSSANLYYSHPILHLLAEDFHTTQNGAATIPTLAQAGEAACLLLIMPLADFFPRRRFTLVMVTLATVFWLGLCLTNELAIFNVLTFMSALFTCVVHVVIPLVSELSPPGKRAFNLSIVGIGPTVGVLLARILAGVVAQYTHWRNVYWIGLGVQLSVLMALYLFMPDYRAINDKSRREIVVTYPRILWSIFVLYWKHPVLVQACLLAFISFVSLTSFWTTLTFLLSESPYNYGSAVIGLFGLIGAVTLLLGPLFGKFIIGPLKVPLYSVTVGTTLSLTGVLLGTFLGTFTIAGPVIEAILLDAGLIVTFIANRLSIEGIEPGAANRVNTAFMIIMHLGQLAGTKGGNQIYSAYGGWVPAGLWAMGITVASYFVVLLRGPYESGWIGWRGGWQYREDKLGCATTVSDKEAASAERDERVEPRVDEK